MAKQIVYSEVARRALERGLDQLRDGRGRASVVRFAPADQSVIGLDPQDGGIEGREPPEIAAMLAAGLDGLATEADWREPVNTNIWEMSHRERRRLRVDDLPQSLAEACDELEKDDVICAALGEHITQQFLAAKRAEWQEYNQQVSAWELERYLGRY